MPPMPIDLVCLADLIPKDAIRDTVAEPYLDHRLGSFSPAVALPLSRLMGEFAKLHALMDDTESLLARLVAKSDGV